VKISPSLTWDALVRLLKRQNSVVFCRTWFTFPQVTRDCWTCTVCVKYVSSCSICRQDSSVVAKQRFYDFEYARSAQHVRMSVIESGLLAVYVIESRNSIQYRNILYYVVLLATAQNQLRSQFFSISTNTAFGIIVGSPWRLDVGAKNIIYHPFDHSQ